MPINPNLALGLNPVQIADPIEQFAKIQGVRNMLAQGPIQQAQLERLNLDNEQTRLENEAMPAKAEAARRAAETAEKTALLAQRKTELENLKIKTGLMANMAGGIKYAPEDQRPALYQSNRAQGIQSGLFKPEEVPEQYDPAFVDKSFRASIDAEKQIENNFKELDFAQKVVDAAPKTLKEWSTFSMENASASKSQAELDATRAMLKAAGAPAPIVASIPAMWSPAAMETLAEKTLTSDQRADNKRAADAAKEAGRHNLATEQHGKAVEDLTRRGQNMVNARDQGRLVQIMGPQGTPMWVRENDAVGKPAAQAARAVTGSERKVLGFYNRAKEAMETITTSDKSGKSIEDKMANASTLRQAQLEKGWNVIQTPEQQAYRQAQRTFTEARLRKESGAAVPPHEYVNDAKTYFAVFGDDPQTVAQKREARQIVLDGIRNESGKAYDEFYGEPAPKGGKKAVTEASSVGAPSVGSVQDGYKFKGGDPSKPESWEKVK